MNKKPIWEWNEEDCNEYFSREERVLAGEITTGELYAWMEERGLVVDPLIVNSLAQRLADKEAKKTGIQFTY